MRYQTAISALALIAEAVIAATLYDIRLYSDAGCNNEGKLCPPVKKKVCCDDSGTAYHAAKAVEHGQTTLNDELRIHRTFLGDNCGLSLGQHDDSTCLASDNKDVTGAMVYESGRKRNLDGLDDRCEEKVQVDSYFYEDGENQAMYVVPLNSDHGAEVSKMKRFEERRDYAINHGERVATAPIRNSKVFTA